MIAGLFALAFAALFLGATLYISLVEHPARLTLDDESLLREWKPSEERGFALLAGAAVVSAILGLGAYYETNDFRFIVAAIIIVASWPYTYFVLVPMNNELVATPTDLAGPEVRELVRKWGFYEGGQAVLGVIAALIYLWALV